jgi:hypothetical protein
LPVGSEFSKKPRLQDVELLGYELKIKDRNVLLSAFNIGEKLAVDANLLR